MVPSKISSHLLFIFLCLFILFGNSQYVFSDDVTFTTLNNLNFHENSTIIYCPGIQTDYLIGNRNNDAFGINGVVPNHVGDPDPNGIINERIAGHFTGKATLNLKYFTDHGITSFELNFHDNHHSWDIIIIPSVTLDPFGSYCTSDPSFVLTGGAPAGGYYTVNGVVTTSFNPAIYGSGTFDVRYHYPGTIDCESPLRTITVNAPSAIIFNPVSDVCIYTAPFPLTQAIPAGGTYTGTGVIGGVFFPAVAGVGTHTISYSYSSGSCMSSATQTIKVSAVPTLSFTGLDPAYCEPNSPATLNGIVNGEV